MAKSLLSTFPYGQSYNQFSHSFNPLLDTLTSYGKTKTSCLALEDMLFVA